MTLFQLSEKHDRRTGGTKELMQSPHLASLTTMANEDQLDWALFVAMYKYLRGQRESTFWQAIPECHTHTILNDENGFATAVRDYLPSWTFHVHYNKKNQHSGWVTFWSSSIELVNLLRGLNEMGEKCMGSPLRMMHSDLELDQSQIQAEKRARHIKRCTVLQITEAWLYPTKAEKQRVLSGYIEFHKYIDMHGNQLTPEDPLSWMVMEEYVAEWLQDFYTQFNEPEQIPEVDYHFDESCKKWKVEMTFANEYCGYLARTLCPGVAVTLYDHCIELNWS